MYQHVSKFNIFYLNFKDKSVRGLGFGVWGLGFGALGFGVVFGKEKHCYYKIDLDFDLE